MIKLNTMIQTRAIIILLVTLAKIIANVISPAVKGAYKNVYDITLNLANHYT